MPEDAPRKAVQYPWGRGRNEPSAVLPLALLSRQLAPLLGEDTAALGP